MSTQKYLYIVFSATPYRVGSIIRFFTKNRYNHVSVSFHQNLQTLYSFARYHKNAPLYGGFVRESCLRYRRGDKYANIKVCRIPVSDEQKNAIKEYIESLDEKCYNLISVPFALIKKKYRAIRAYTCVEFVVSLLCEAKIGAFCEEKFYSINDLEQQLSEYAVYEGSFKTIAKGSTWGRDKFPEHCNGTLAITKAVTNTVKTLK